MSNVSELNEVRERFAERAKRRELHPVHEETKLEIAKDFLKELVRGTPFSNPKD